MHENYDLEQLMELVEKRQFRRLREELAQMNEVDIAEFLDELEVEQEILVFRLLPKELAAAVFTYLEDSEDQEKLIGALSDKELREVLDELYLDDTVRQRGLPYSAQHRRIHPQPDQPTAQLSKGFRRFHYDHGVCLPSSGRHRGAILCPNPEGGPGQGDGVYLLCH